MFWNVKQSRSAAGWMWEYHIVSGKGNRDVILNNVDNGQPKTI